MTILEINDVDVWPYVAKGGVVRSVRYVDGGNGGVTKDGKTHLDRIAKKVDYEITCNPMSEEDLTTLLSAFDSTYLEVTTDDPEYGERTAEFYCDNIPSTQMMRRPDGSWWWHEISFTLNER